MNKTISITLFLFFSINNFIISQSLKTFNLSEMRDDIDTLVKSIEDTHINPYYKYSRADFYNDVRVLKKQLKHPLNTVDFYLLIQPLIAKLEDGHTDIKPPIHLYNQSNPSVLPYIIKLSPSKPYIISSQYSLPFSKQLPDGAEIVSINNVPASKIVNDIINLNTGETRAFRADFGANYFDFYLQSLYKTNGTYRISYLHGNKKNNIIIKGIPQQEFSKLLKHYSDSVSNTSSPENVYYTLKLLPEIKTALFDFRSFEDLDRFNVFIDSAFTVIKKNEIKNIIIDIRKNSGGDSDIGDEFIQYFAKTPFRQYDKVIEKHSRLLKERLLDHRIGKILTKEDSIFLNKSEGLLDTVVYEDIPLKNTPFRFDGNVYVLTSYYTFSSAADFAQCIKHYKLGKIIGEETGGLIVSYGDIVTSHLPHTQLVFTISSKLYYNIGADKNDWKGVNPDLKIPADKAMDAALKLVHFIPDH
ncbi:S41 family peptidase [Chitinophaga silvisoli]|uniref:Tail specific protease domain-containing protein n=1 Tax=Chitinophaga silvisoli TaxID=2291814 RepID=A0A3E1NWW7_9BACT|nr:S41 family peptidase [Chitinophaga silvisoli]RFM32419.1 hypothetical protein DXN04_22295 [Chitinophaga silvisoli]